MFIYLCAYICAQLLYKTAQNSSDDFPSYPLDNYHCSGDVYWRGGTLYIVGVWLPSEVSDKLMFWWMMPQTRLPIGHFGRSHAADSDENGNGWHGGCVKFCISGDAHADNMSLLEKLAKFSMSYSGVNSLSDFDPLTGSLSNKSSTLHTDTQTTMCSTARGNLGIQLFLET